MQYCIDEISFAIIHKGADKSCQMQNELNILINIVQKYHIQQCIIKMPVPIVPTENGNFKYEYRQRLCWE